MVEAGYGLAAAQRAAFRRRAPLINRVTIDLPDAVPIDVLADRLRELCGELEILRTTFSAAVGAALPLQIVEDGSPTLTITGDRAAGPLLALEVAGSQLSVSAEEQVADHESLRLLAELLIGAREPETDPLQYVDFAGWEAEQLADDSPERRLAAAFWPAPAAAGGTPATMSCSTVQSPTTAEPAAWLAAWVSVLQRNGIIEPGEATIRVRVTGRTGSEVEAAVGPYARLVPLALPALDSVAAGEAIGTTRSLLADADRFTVFAPDDATGSASFAIFPAGAVEPALPEDGTPSLVITGDATCTVRAHADAERLAGHLLEVLQYAALHPDDHLGDAPMLTADEVERVVAAGTGPEQSAPSGTVLSAFLRHVAERPDAVAITDGVTELTYAELDRRSAATATEIEARSNPGTPVGVLVDRTVATLVAIVAAMRCGVPFQPLHPDLPARRLADQLARTGATAVVTSGRALDGFATITVDDADEAHPGRPGDGDPDAALYLLATSGSTGTPKIVEVTDRNALAYSAGVTSRLGLTDASKLGVVTSLSTDLAYTMVFPALLAGASIRLFSADEAADAAALDRAATSEGVTAMKMTPSLGRALLAGADQQLRVDLLIFGGEALDAGLVERAYAAGAGRVVNHYGPTETTIGATTHHIRRGDIPPGHAGPVPIGRALPGVRTYVLDGHRQPRPWGVPGQLAIAGDGVSAGYIGDADATANAFVRLDVGGHTELVYLTGDQVRLGDDGALTFLGRGDGQVKIRGFRVELGEIEHAARTHPHVVDAAVVLDPRDDDADTLIAYVAGRAKPDAAEVTDLLAAVLPAYMVPEHVVVLDELPRLANGKLDRSALPEPEADLDEELTPPGTPTEIALHEIWLDVLPVGRLGIDDDFFFVGGHSLLATRIMARAKSSFGVELPLHLIFSHSTVRTLSAEIDARGAEATATESTEDLIARLQDMDEDEARLLLERELGRLGGND